MSAVSLVIEAGFVDGLIFRRERNLLRATGRLSLLESYASYWLLRKNFTDHDYNSALYYADILLRTSPQSSIYVVPLLAQIRSLRLNMASLWLN